jgi:hypothetical protein
VNAIFQPDGLRSFEIEFKNCSLDKLDGQAVRVLPRDRVIASKRASGRDKDLAVLPVLERTLRPAKRLKARKSAPGRSNLRRVTSQHLTT